ncbi:response regulator [Chamaesiphon sp. GL140_3_metabinner_50]|uniref:response regulator n=1 Tax=Chamaesiphon sp. GL140_3_metabinner_50 TaxID=2970812 RepID=UPI0025FCB912|nr:response regulator [Chamaesiphon sp. GL140_3_metabinner_50]
MLAASCPEPIKILLVDDLRVVREKLKSLLQPHRDFQIIGTAIDGYNAIEQLEHLQPDIILLDLDMPRLDGLQTARIISQKYPDIKIIILSSYNDNGDISDFPNSCIKAYIVKGNIDREIADKIREVSEPSSEREKVVKFDRVSKIERSESSQLQVRQTNNFTTNFEDNSSSQFTAIAHTTLSKLNDWSSSAKELIDMMPLPWTRGLLYLLVAFVGIAIPWACFYQMDEIGTARGRLEAKGNTIKREADIEGSVAVLKVYVKKGDIVKAGQIIMELDAKNVREQLYQNQLKLDGAQQRLDRLFLMKNQMGLGTTAQQQQNQAQLLEKQSQIAQAQQNIATLETNSRNQIAEKLAQLRQAEQTLVDRQSSYNLQQAEKLTQVRQAVQGVLDAKTNHLMAQNRLTDAQTEVSRYNKLYQTGAVAQIKTKEIASIALEKNQLFTQALATLQQSKLRVKEQQENYQKILQQGRADIAQAQLRLREQQEIYRGTISRNQSDIAGSKLRLVEQQRGSQSLIKGGNIAVLKTEQQFREIESQIVTLKSEITRDREQSNFLTSQIKKHTIQANTDGTIFELPIDREGAVVQPKQLIVEIASNTSGLVFKGEIPATQSESLRTSLDAKADPNIQKDVKLKFDEFPFESYDVVKGKLTWVAPNSKISQMTSGGTMASYEIEVQLGQSCIKYEGNCLQFKSGQPATAEIVIRHRRIIDFILDPFKKLSNNNR